MEGLKQSERLHNHEHLDDSSQENKGEALHALVDDDEEGDEEGVDNDHARPRKSATKGTFSLADLNRLALKPGLTTKELASGFWNLQGRLEEDPDDPERRQLNDTFVKNILLGRNLEVFLEVDKSLSFGKGMILQLMFAAVRVGDEEAVVRLVSLLRRRRYNKINVFHALEQALRIDLSDEVPHLGFRGLIKEIVRLKIVKPGNRAVTTTYSCKDFIENFDVLRCSKHALTAIDEVLGPQVWHEVRCDKAIAAQIAYRCKYHYAELARSGVLECLLRHNVVVLTPKLSTHISQYLRAPPLYKDNPHILSLIDYCNEAGFPILETEEDDVQSLICYQVVYVRVNRLHNLLEFFVPAESSCTVRDDGLLDEPRPPPHIVKKRAMMVLDAICKRGHLYSSQGMHAGLPLQHYLFHELQLNIELVSEYCRLHVVYLGPTSPLTLVDKVLRIVQANVPKLDIDKWKELFKQGVYPVPAYYGDQDKEGVQSSAEDKMDKFRKSLGYYRANKDNYNSYSSLTLAPTHETLEYLRPWYHLCGTMLSEETKFSMGQAMDLCFASDFRAQAMVEADMIRISDELRDEWCQNIRNIGHVYLKHLSNSLFPIYLKWYEYTKDRELRQVLQVVSFATACATNHISEAKTVLRDMLQPSSGQDPCAKVSSRRAYLLTMAACTGNLPFVKWVFAQIQAAFPVESREKLKDLADVSGPDRTKIEWRNHQLTIPAWLDLMTYLTPVSNNVYARSSLCPTAGLNDPFLSLTYQVLRPPCPKCLMETGLLLAQTDPLAVLPLIFRVIIMKQQSIQVWDYGHSFYDSLQEEHNARDDDNNDDEEEETGLYGTNPVWAWGPITLVKLIELIADETTGTADTILNAKEQTEGI